MLVEGVKPALIENAGRMSGMPMPALSLASVPPWPELISRIASELSASSPSIC